MLSLTYVGGQRQENNSHHHCNHNHHGRMYEYDTRTTRTTSNSMFSGYGGGCGGVYGTLGVVAVYVDPTRPFFSLVPYVLFSCSSKTLIVQFDQNDHQHHHHYHHGGMNEHDTNTSRLCASEPVVVVVALPAVVMVVALPVVGALVGVPVVVCLLDPLSLLQGSNSCLSSRPSSSQPRRN